MVSIPEQSTFVNDSDTSRPTRATISLAAIKANYKSICDKVAPSNVIAVLKANAYGHGLVPVAKALEEVGANFFGVAFVEEALELRAAGISANILPFGGLSGRQLNSFLNHNIDITASSVSKLQQIDAFAAEQGKIARVHYKIDTGLGRIGQQHSTAEKLFEAGLNCQNIKVVGVFSHFAMSEEENLDFTRLQLERFLECTHFFEQRSLEMPMRNISNSGAIARLPEANLDAVRPGLMLYGIKTPYQDDAIPLTPALTLRTEIVYFKILERGMSVGYDQTWQANEQTRLATLPIGYGDGYPRALSNRGRVLIREKFCPIVGIVSMDQIVVDLGPTGIGYNGDEVILIGRQGEEKLDLTELAKLSGANPREILVGLNARIPRIYADCVGARTVGPL